MRWARRRLQLAAALTLAAACSTDSQVVGVDLRVAFIDGHGDDRAACAPRRPVSFLVASPWGAPVHALASRDPDLRIDVEVGDTIEVTRVPAMAGPGSSSISTDVWVAEWVAESIEEEALGLDLELLAWCDVLIEVDGVSLGSAELRPGTRRLPVGTFASLAAVGQMFPNARIETRELSEFEASSMMSFWGERDRSLWRLIACEPVLRERLEAEDPEGFAAALAELESRGAVECGEREGEGDDRVR